jgi:hypothetical protein
MIINIASTNITGYPLNWLKAVSLILCSFLLTMGIINNANAEKFDHDETHFPLDIVHARQTCDACHIQGVFRGTPTQCSGCHSNSGRIQASAPSPSHMRTTDDCEFCHQTGNWENVARVDHFAVTGECQSCHNGIVAIGKNPGHIQSSDVCDNCHRTNSWQDAVFDHEGITANCQLCHNGVIATGKNTNHIQTTNSCEDCHTTITFDPVYRVDHISVIGNCSSCHNGILAEGKPATHMLTNLECDNCHTTISWSNSTWNHQNVENVSCESCHNGVSATGKPANHFVTSKDCEVCHTTVNWTPKTYVHSSTNVPVGGKHDTAVCTACHGSNNEIPTWNTAYGTECAACHAEDYEQDKHEASGGGFESVAENADCSGSCHQQNSSYHRVTDSSWDR